MVPDTPTLGAPLVAAAVAAGLTTILRVGTFVLVAPVRELARRRDTVGTSYVTVNAESIDDLAPVVERLAGT